MTKHSFDENEGFKKGKEVWFEMRGPKVAEAAMEQAAQHEMTRDLRQYLFEHCFAAVWARPGLERATRSIITISVLTALGRTEELKSHIRMGLNNGLTREELKEIFLHVGIYAGNGQFVHATHRGSPVSLTPLDADYYRQNYMTAVRLAPR